MRAWKWTMPRCWYSATFAYCTVTQLRQPRLGDAEVSGEGAAQVDGEPAPQLRGPPLPHEVALVVVAVPAQRLPELLVPVARAGGVADRRPAVLAHPVLAFGGEGAAGAAAAGAVHEPERGRGQGREDQRVLADRVGDALAAGDPGTDQVERVRGVQPRAGRALGGATVAAAHVQHPERGLGRGERAEDLTGAGVDRLRAAVQADRLGAVPDPGRRPRTTRRSPATAAGR